MRIAIVAPLFESVPPKLYGGTERVVSYLAEELVRQGHEVSLFASGDSVTRARLLPMCERGLRLDPGCHDSLAPHVAMVDAVAEMARKFDVIHFNIDYLHFPLTRHLRLPVVTTLHGRLDIPELVPLYRRFSEIPLVSISNAQRQPLSWANWIATVHHGLPLDLYRLHPDHGGYLCFLGRLSPNKGPDRAIRIAHRAGMDLRIAAKIDPENPAFFEGCLEKMFKEPGVTYLGEISEQDKNDFLGHALALLFPISWPEPFGLAMIEAMACGTPVIAYPRGSVTEIIEDGVNGFLVANEEEAAAAVEKCRDFDRAACREVFARRFSAARMARDYLDVYQRVADATPAGA